MNILLVEDEAIIALNERLTLERSGYSVRTAASAEEAVRMASAQPEPDLILMDIDLGRGMDGTDAARAILQSRDVPIVFLSSHTEPEVVEKTEAITSYGYIPKSAGDAIMLGSIKMAFRLFEAKSAIAESETAYRSMFEANPHPMWVYDLETLRFLAVNDAAVHRYGYAEKEFLAMSIRDIRPEEDVPRLLKNVASVDSGLDPAGLWRHRKRNGELIYVEITSHTIDWKGRRAEVVLAHDVSSHGTHMG
jgi:PAS domain S-box-containing protein